MRVRECVSARAAFAPLRPQRVVCTLVRVSQLIMRVYEWVRGCDPSMHLCVCLALHSSHLPLSHIPLVCFQLRIPPHTLNEQPKVQCNVGAGQPDPSCGLHSPFHRS